MKFDKSNLYKKSMERITIFMYKNNALKWVISGLLFIFIVWYLLPDFIMILFHTWIGILILLIICLLIGVGINKFVGIIALIICIILYRSISSLKVNNIKNKVEEFNIMSSNRFNSNILKKIDNFINLNKLVNPNIIFNEKILAEQVNELELDTIITTGLWPWSLSTIKKYEIAVHQNPYIQNNPEQSILYARKIYNEKAILEVMNLQKQGF